MPTVTVLMAVHNAERFVGAAIASILAQTFRDFELLIVDDGSTDQTTQIVKQVEDRRIRHVAAGRRLGLPGALNLGMETAAGELIARHDHDDLSHPQRLERQVAYFARHPEVSLLGTRAWLVDESGRRTGRLNRCLDDTAIRWYHLLDNPFVHSSVMFRRRVVWDELGGYDASLPSSEDYELWARLLRRHTAANLPDRLLSYRLSSVSKMAADESAWEQGPFPETLRKLVKRHISTTLGEVASDDELRLMGGFVLGVPVDQTATFVRVFWRLCDAYERRFPDARRSPEFRRTLATQIDAVAARQRPFSRGAALRLYAAALFRRPSLSIVFPWWRVAGRLTLGARGRVHLARLRREHRAFSVTA